MEENLQVESFSKEDRKQLLSTLNQEIYKEEEYFAKSNSTILGDLLDDSFKQTTKLLADKYNSKSLRIEYRDETWKKMKESSLFEKVIDNAINNSEIIKPLSEKIKNIQNKNGVMGRFLSLPDQLLQQQIRLALKEHLSDRLDKGKDNLCENAIKNQTKKQKLQNLGR